MEADDRGYINNARSIFRLVGCSVGDLEMLIAKRFVLVREDKLLLIKGWRVNNTIQPSRLSESQYVNDLKQLFFKSKDDLSYTEHDTGLPVISGQIATQETDDKDPQF